MSKAVRTIVTFQSTKFNTSKPLEPPTPPGDFGSDVCRWMMEKLAERGVRCSGPYVEGPSDLVEDERGVWSIAFSIGKVEYTIDCGLRSAATKDKPAVWAAQIFQSPCDGIFANALIGQIARLAWEIAYRDRRDQIDPAVTEAIHEVLSADPAISHIQWHNPANFKTDKEESLTN
jgi:hypothetical protein